MDGLSYFKRPAFAYEQEIRATISSMDDSSGFSVKVVIPSLIEEVLISPRADEPTRLAVAAVMAKFAPDVPWRLSDLLNPPSRRI